MASQWCFRCAAMAREVMVVDGCGSCNEFEGVSRRGFVGLASAISVVAGLEVFAASPAAAASGRNVLVVVSLRGGIDGMSLLVPHGDPAYYKARPRIGVPRDQLWGGDGFFGLGPALKPLQRMWDEKKVALVTATGLSQVNRSHFDAMAQLEMAGSGSDRSGWVGRMTGASALADKMAGVSLTRGLPTLMRGSSNTVNGADLNGLRLSGLSAAYPSEVAAARRKFWSSMWGEVATSHPLRPSALEALAVSDTASSVVSPTSTVKYDGGSGGSFAAMARLIRSGVPVSVGHIEAGSWDTHSGMGDGASWMGYSFGSVASNIDAFFRDIGDSASRVTLVTISEFGRRTAENSSGGLEHGWGNTMIVAGAGVAGGRVYGRWPGLGTKTDVDSDLQVTTDYRSVFYEVVSRRFPGVSAREVFPGFAPSPVGVVTS